MRIAVLSILAVLVSACSAAAAGATAAAPTLRIGPGEQLTVVGAGFPARALVRIRVRGEGVDRAKTVRTSVRGRLTARFLLGRCDASAVTAAIAGRVRARVPTSWFVRECPPPPPLQPGTGTG